MKLFKLGSKEASGKDEKDLAPEKQPSKFGSEQLSNWVKANVMIPKEVSAERLSICRSCEDFVQSTGFCSVCKCYMPAKTRFGATTCPKGKWSRYQV